MVLLQLGSFIWEMDDYPAQVDVGGQQLIAQYQYPGGIKDIQTFGTFYDPIKLAGTFNYTDAEAKVQSINKMFQSGNIYPFRVGSYVSLLVTITKFKPTYRSFWAIDYSIELEPLRDAPAIPPTKSPSHTSSNNPTKTVTHPPKTNKPAPQRTYIVQKGDTLWGIAKKYYGSGSQYGKIVKANHIKNPSQISPGQKLVIP